MKNTARLLNLLFTIPFIVWAFSIIIIEYYEELFQSIPTFVSIFIISLSIQFFVWKKLGYGFNSISDYAINSGFILSSIVFTLFFFGPIYFTPEANQGPLAGIIFGPVALVSGFIIGWITGLIKRRNERVKVKNYK